MLRPLEKTSIELCPTSPFNFDFTFHKPDHFPSQDTTWEQGKAWQTMLFQGQKLGLFFRNSGTTEKPKITLEVFSKEKLTDVFIESLKHEIVWRYNLDLDLSAFYQENKNNTALAPVIKKFKGMRPAHSGSLYEYLIISIVLQNATVKRSVSMLQSLFENYGTLLEYDGQKLWCFWEPKALSSTKEDELRKLKVGYRAKSIIKVSQSFANQEIDELDLRTKKAENQEKELISLYGIGPASVGYIMFDVFHHWDHLKHISPWEQKIYSKIFFDKDYETELIPVEKMIEYFDKWGKWKGLAVNYIWEDVWWKRKNENISWLEKLIRL